MFKKLVLSAQCSVLRILLQSLTNTGHWALGTGHFLLFIFLLTQPVHAKPTTPISQKLWQGITTEDLELLKKISVALERKSYDEALGYAHQMKYNYEGQKVSLADAVIDVVLWNKYSDKIDLEAISFSDISRFALDNPFYPNLSSIHRNVERVAIANNIPYQASQRYFSSNPAGTVESKIYFLDSEVNALASSSLKDEELLAERKKIHELIANIWVKENLSLEQERNFFVKYRDQLSELDHVNRIERLLWDGRADDAQRNMHLVDDDHRKLFEVISEFEHSSPRHIDKLFHEVPWSLRKKELLTYRRILWYRAKDKQDELLELMIDLPEDSKFPEKWWSLRRLYGREMIKQKNYKAAYRLIAPHNLPKTSPDFWEAEWTTGWIALRFLGKPKDAYSHFANLYRNVTQPVTLSRATYWLAMAAGALGDKQQAIDWYKAGTKYPVFFYGQLAIHKHRLLDSVGAQGDIILPRDPVITGKDMAYMAESRATQIAYLLALTGDKQNAGKVFEWIVNNAKTDGQIGVVMKLVNEIGDRQIDARISRIAARRNVFFIKDKFQIIREVSNDEYAPLVHAIIKQESSFAPMAISPVGAIGYMQIMPDTAKRLAKELGIRYNKQKLATDINYNIHLGSFYIRKLIERFGGSEMMAIAAYNAGPNSVQRWVNEFYDPRKEQDIDKIVDWIELITYSETRNYVQRVMENLIVYKYLMSRANYDSVQ
ncbi:MAG: lytic transglycosylase domain-containing protein [Alphaproteobacteria bacterium]|nr:lytic transglycosylase domain-containing protein [Alphaproteobacteria bacterium]